MKSISEANVRDADRAAENKIQAETQIPMTYRALEPRIAFDAAMAETIDQTTDAPAPAPASTSADVPVLLPSDIRILADLLACGSAAAPAGGGPIVFIDAAVNDPAVIASAAPEGGEIVVLEAGRDGVEQIAAHLAGRHGVDAVHIVSHGTAGELRLGSATLDQQSLSGAHADAMAVIRAALSAEADILLYGCDVAAGSTGEAFVAALASATGADVAASSDDTGAAARGGDWDLETRLGLIEAGLIDAPEWNGLLAPLNISATTSPVVRDNTGAVVSVTAHDANFLTVAVGTAGSTNVHITDPAKMVGATVIWANAGFVGGTAIDLRATVLSVIDTNPNANQPATLNFAINGDDPSVRIENAEVRLRWDAFAAGTYNPATGAGTVARGDVGFFIRDIDAQGNLYAFPGGVKTETYHNLTGVKPQESVRADLDELDRYTTESAATTHLTVGLNVDPDTGATVTDPLSSSFGKITATNLTDTESAESISGVKFNWNNVAAWEVTYRVAPPPGLIQLDAGPAFDSVADASLAGVSHGQRFFDHDGDGDLTFVSAFTVQMRNLDLDSDDSTTSGSGFLATFTEGGSAVVAVDTDVDITGLDTRVVSATITLTNTLSGDQLLVGGSTAAIGTVNGLAYVLGVNGSGQITLQLTGVTSDPTVYETALKQITFNNTSNAPSGTDRLIEVSFSNGTVSSNTALSTIRVLPLNDPPVATADLASQIVGSPVVIAVLGNDSDIDNALDPASVQIAGTASPGASLAVAGEGTWSVNTSTGTITFTPLAGFVGIPTTISYSVADASGERSNSVSVSILPLSSRPHLDLSGQTDKLGGFLYGHNNSGFNAGWSATDGRLTSVSPAAGGPGLVYTNDNSSGYVTGVASTTLGQSIAQDEYISMPFTTGPAMPETWLIYNANRIAGGNYQFAFAISTDGFQSATLLSQNNAPNTGVSYDANPSYSLAQGTDYQLQAATNYEMRVYFYAVGGGAATTFTWDGVYTLLANDPTSHEATFTEGGASVSISAAAVTIEDADTTNLTSGNILLTNKQTDDRFIIGTTVVGNGSIGTIGSISYSVTETAGPIEIALSGSATKGAYAALINSIKFENTSQEPSSTDRSITVTVNDGGQSSNVATALLHVIPVNDAPMVALGGPGVAISTTGGSFEGTSASISRNMHNETAPPGWSQSGSVDIFNSSTNFNGYAWAPTPDGGDFVHALDSGTGYREGLSQTLTGLTPGQTYTITFSQSISDNGFNASGDGHWQVDVGAQTFSSATMTTPALGTAAGWQSQTITFTATATSETISFTASGTGSNRVDLGIDGVTVIAAPLVDTAVTYTEDMPAISVANTALADVFDSGENDITSFSIAASGIVDGANEIVSIGGASFPLNSNSTQSVTIGGTTFNVAYTVAGGFAITTAGGGVMPQADLDALVRGITYENTDQAPVAGNRTLTFTATDAGGLTSAPAVATITVVPVNDSVIISLNGGPTVRNVDDANTARTFTEGDAPVAVTDPTAYVNDFGENDFFTLALSLSGFADGSAEKLTIGGATFTFGAAGAQTVTVGSTTFDVVYMAGFNVITIEKVGDTPIPIADINALMRGITYENTSQAPTAGVRQIGFFANEAMSVTTDFAYSRITVAPVNDAPIVDLNSAATTADTNRDLAVTFNEGDVPVAVAALAADLNDIAEADVTRLTIVAAGVRDGAFEQVAIGGQVFDLTADSTQTATIGGTTVQIDYVASTGTFTVANTAGITTPMAQADLDTLVRGITYENTDQAPVAGNRTLTFTATDSGGLTSAPAVATITVVPVNDPPVGGDDAASIDENAASVGGNVITLAPGVDIDVDGGLLTVTAAMQGTTPITIGVPFTTAGGGVLTLNDNGSYTFVPGAAYNGLDENETVVETIVYTVDDGNGGVDTALLVITITGANDGPVVIDPANPINDPTSSLYDPENPAGPADPLNIIPDVATTDGATLTPINVGNFVRDPDDEPLTFTLGATTPTWLSIDPATGEITGAPPADASQLTNTGNPGEYLITITATDPDGQLITTTVTLTIVNLPPVALHDAASVGEDDASVTGNVIADPVTGDADTAPDSDPLMITAALQGTTPITIGVPFTTAGGGVLTLNDDGSYTFEPGSAYNGLDVNESKQEEITYTVSDGNGATTTAKLVITMTGANDAPVVIDPANPVNDPTSSLYDPESPAGPADTFNIIADVATTDGATLTPINVGDFVRDPDGEPLTFTATGLPPGMSIDRDTGIITGTLPPDASQNGPYTVLITATDIDGAKVETTITYTVDNLPPIAEADVATVETGRTVTLNVLANDRDPAPDNDPLRVVAAVAEHGTVTINPDGTISYMANPGYDGDDVVTYRITDGNGGFASATVKVSVTAIAVPLMHAPSSPAALAATAFEPIQVDGIILDAVRGLAGQPTVSANGLVLDMVAALRQQDVARGDTWSRGTGDYDVKGLSSFSLKLSTAASGATVAIETFVRDNVLIVQLNLDQALRNRQLVEWKVQGVDGRPLPDWLAFAGTNLLMGQRAANSELLDLRIVGIFANGDTVLHDVRIVTKTGEVQPLQIGRSGAAAPAEFWNQIRVEPTLTGPQAQELGRSLGRR